MRRAVLIGAAILVGLPALALGGWAFYSRTSFGTWNPNALPSRISYCARTFTPGPHHHTRTEIEDTGNALGRYPLVQVGTAAGGVPYFAKPLPDSVRHTIPCSMTVCLKVGSDDYIAYGISGGP